CRDSLFWGRGWIYPLQQKASNYPGEQQATSHPPCFGPAGSSGGIHYISYQPHRLFYFLAFITRRLSYRNLLRIYYLGRRAFAAVCEYCYCCSCMADAASKTAWP